MQNLTISPLSTLPQVRVLGRCAGTDPLTLFWTGSGIELLFTGSELWVELNADYDTMEPWVSVELDGAWISRFAVNPEPAGCAYSAGPHRGGPSMCGC